MGVNLAAMAVGARLFCQTTASLWQLPLPFLPAVTLKIILPGTLPEVDASVNNLCSLGLTLTKLARLTSMLITMLALLG